MKEKINMLLKRICITYIYLVASVAGSASLKSTLLKRDVNATHYEIPILFELRNIKSPPRVVKESKAETKTTTTTPTTASTTITIATPEVVCEEKQFRCSEKSCIPIFFVCDGDNDCENGYDEKNCTNSTCSTFSFRCHDGRCIWMSWLCDGSKDCLGGEDEVDCIQDTTSTTTILTEHSLPQESTTLSTVAIEPATHKPMCDSLSFQCNNGKCIPSFWRCDETPDCSEGEDEMLCFPDLPPLIPPPCDLVYCSSCFSDIGASSSGCPREFVEFEGHCLWINTYPLKWPRARESCMEKNADLAQFAYDDQFRGRLLEFLKGKSLNGLNYWIDIPFGAGTYRLPEKEMQIPAWLLNGRVANGKKFSPYVNDCYFLAYDDFQYYKSTDCNDYGGSICVWNGVY